MEIDQDHYDRIAAVIESDASPVGIDAKKTHILILDLLLKLDARLTRIEQAMSQPANQES